MPRGEGEEPVVWERQFIGHLRWFGELAPSVLITRVDFKFPLEEKK
jgi:hypothetical protein